MIVLVPAQRQHLPRRSRRQQRQVRHLQQRQLHLPNANRYVATVPDTFCNDYS
jgi:hypothetical protein